MLDGTSALRGTVGLARLDASNLAAAAVGCGLLSAGGGGDPQLSLVMARRAVEEHGPVALASLDDLSPDALIMPCGLIGSPTIAEERIFNGDEGRVLVEAVEGLRGERVVALMPYEIAGLNGLLPVTWAARLGLPLLDADGRGRAFPELQQQAMHLADVRASPVVLTDGRGNTVVVEAADDAWAERLARAGAVSLGGVCAGAMCCMTAQEAREAAIAGSVTTAHMLGAAAAAEDPAGRPEAIAQALGGTVVIRGRVVEIERGAGAGFVHGSATIEAVENRRVRRLRLELQNEFLLAIEDGEVRAAVPDIISVLEMDDGAPVATERLGYGQRVSVIALPAHEVWRSDAALALVGPRTFGYDVDHAPIGGATGAGA